MIICEILLLAAIVVFVVDISGFTESWRRPLTAWLKRNTSYEVKHFPPFDCSLCLTFWAGLIWLAIRGAFTLPNVAFVCLAAYLTIPIGTTLTALRDLLLAVLNWIITKIEKI